MSPYRTSERVIIQNFSFTEKLFLSGKTSHKFLGHSIMIVAPFVRSVLPLVMFMIASAIGLTVAIGGLYLLVVYLMSIHMKMYSIVILLICLFISPIIIIPTISAIKKMVKENNVHMKKVLVEKLNLKSDN